MQVQQVIKEEEHESDEDSALDRELLGPTPKGLARHRSESVPVKKRIAFQQSRTLKSLSSGFEIKVSNVDSSMEPKNLNGS